MNKLHSAPLATADVVRIERFRSDSPRPSPKIEAVVLIFPLASQVDVVRRTACALLSANEHRRKLTFRLWRDGLQRQARRYGHSKRWATAQWIDFENAVRLEIDMRGRETVSVEGDAP